MRVNSAKYPLISNFGILSSISWNSKNWQDNPTKKDIDKSGYKFVKEEGVMHESLNFGQAIYPIENDGYYIGYTPLFNSPPSNKHSKNVKIVFFLSTDYKNKNKRFIVGFYAYPVFGDTYTKKSLNIKYEKYNYGNIKAYPENIVLFENPIEVSNNIVKEYNFISNKKIGKQGFNYLDSINVINILEEAFRLNQNDNKLEKFKVEILSKIRIIDNEKAQEIIGKNNSNTKKGIRKIEKDMEQVSAEVKYRLSKFIERGDIARKVKAITGYRCLICEQLNSQMYGFKKPNGEFYIEAHHVEPVATLKKGVLGVNNIITVCANHHRQLHFGNSVIIENTESNFKIKIDKDIIEIKKIEL